MPIDFAALRGHPLPATKPPSITATAATGAHAEKDALHFMEQLFTKEPPGRILISSTDRGWLTHAATNPTSAVGLSFGVVDAYMRVTLVAGKPRSGRGTAADTSALVAVWLDVDVNGGPDGKGGIVQNGARDRETAIDFLQAVFQPTLLVISGWGLHAYWVLQAPLLTKDEETRTKAQRLVHGWHLKMRAVAADYGMAKFDSVFDLARVLRPVGSLNGKDPKQPRNVKLLDDGGPRYTFGQIEQEIIAPESVVTRPRPQARDNGRRPTELLANYPTLGRIVERAGKAPGDGSDSTWDFKLACTAMRTPSACSDAEVEALIKLNRQRHDDPHLKGERADYIERTIERAREEVGGEANRGEDPVRLISRLWNIEDDPIVAGTSTGTGSSARVRLVQRSGRNVVIRNVGKLADPRAHNREMSAKLGSRFKALGAPAAHDAYQAVLAVCAVQPDDPDVEMRGVLGDLIDVAEKVTGSMWGDAADKFRTLWERSQREREARQSGRSRQIFAIRDEENRHWLTASTVRAAERFDNYGELNALVLGVGWSIERVDMREPDVAADVEAGRVKTVFYVEPRE